MNTENLTREHILGFIEYTYSFYGPGQIYDLGFDITHADIARATAIRLQTVHPDMPFDGDSVDREAVREILILMKKQMSKNITDIVFG